MKQKSREFIRRHAEFVSVGLFLAVALLAAFLAALFSNVTKADIQIGTAVLCVVFAAFFTWARTSMPRLDHTHSGRVATIAEHFKRTRTLSVRIVVPAATAWIVVTEFYPSGLSAGQRNVLMIGGGTLVGVIGTLLMVKGLRCPRCGTNFKEERLKENGRWRFDTRGTEEVWSACPHCGVSFDEPWR